VIRFLDLDRFEDRGDRLLGRETDRRVVGRADRAARDRDARAGQERAPETQGDVQGSVGAGGFVFFHDDGSLALLAGLIKGRTATANFE
jgi:hypothetical protein